MEATTSCFVFKMLLLLAGVIVVVATTSDDQRALPDDCSNGKVFEIDAFMHILSVADVKRRPFPLTCLQTSAPYVGFSNVKFIILSLRYFCGGIRLEL